MLKKADFALLVIIVMFNFVAYAQDSPSKAPETKAPFAHELLYYYNGPVREEVVLALDELKITGEDQQTVSLDAIRGVATGATVSRLPDGAALVTRQAAPADRAGLDALADRLKSQGYEVTAIVYRPYVSARDNQSRRFLTRRLSVKTGALRDLATAFNLRLIERVSYSPDTFIVETVDGSLTNALEVADTIYESGRAEFATPLIERQQQPRFLPNDPLFPNQWHLQNTGQVSGAVGGNDVNILGAWDTATGAGVNIAVVDTGVEVLHPDLAANARTDIDIDLNDNDFDPTPAVQDHGTSVAGVAAAVGNNSFGVTGAAFEAGIVGVRLIEGPTTDNTEAQAMAYQVNPAIANNRVHINTNSWGPIDDGATLETMGPLTLAAVEFGIENGRGGLGTIYLWAAGNGRKNGDNVNYDGYASNRFTIAVGATGGNGVFSFYSEPGASMLVNTPSSYSSAGITTTDISGTGGASSGDFTSGFGGTSSATPLAAGIVALMLETNPNLTWRDVQHILVTTATQNDPGNAGWFLNDAGHHFNHAYGFGRVNAATAVTTAAAWTNVSPSLAPLTASENMNVAIPDNNSTGITRTLDVVAPAGFAAEHVELTTSITHTFRGNLELILTAPTGTQSVLAERHGDQGNDYSNWTFTSVAHWGENPTGAWSLRIRDLAALDVGTLDNWTLTVHGFNAVAVISVNPSSLFTHRGASEAEFSVVILGGGGTEWSAAVTAGSEWLSIVTEPAELTGPGTIVASLLENTSGSERSGTITIMAPGASNTPFNVTVTQSEFPLSSIHVPFFKRIN